MDRSHPIILLTRPEAQSIRFAESLPEAHVIISPLTEIVFTDLVDLPKADAYVVTSSNALRSVEASDHRLTGRRIFCVGQSTANLAQGLGAEVVRVAPTAAALAELIKQAPPSGRLCYLRGQSVSFDMSTALNSAGIETNNIVVYDQHDRALTTEATAALKGDQPIIAPVFSAMSAQRLADALPSYCAPVILVAISPNVADAWTGPKPLKITIADEPTAEAMRRAVTSHIR